MVTLSSKIREQLISSFGAELAEHVQTMTDGLLVLEQNQLSAAQRQMTLEEVFRAAHSLKGAARALGVSAVEQLAHALENVLDLMQKGELECTGELFTICYRALDTIQLVQAIYDSGGTTPPVQVLQTLAELEAIRTETSPRVAGTSPQMAGTAPEVTPQNEKTPVVRRRTAVRNTPERHNPAPQEPVPAEHPSTEPVPTAQTPAETGARSEKTASHIESIQPEAVDPAHFVTEEITPANAVEDTVRVSVGKLDALMTQISELLGTKIRAEQRVIQVNRAQEVLGQWQKEWLGMRRTYGRLLRKLPQTAGNAQMQHDVAQLLEYVNSSQEQMRHVQTLVNALSRDYAHDTLHASLVIDALEQEVKQVRMLPFNTITAAFGRMVRDLAKAAQKEAVLHIVGGEVEMDKRVLEQIKDPLIHLLRNAIDHGLETQEERIALGKPPVGRITLSAEQAGKEVILRVADDGHGLDLEAIRQTALRKNDIAARVDEMSESELVELIFTSRFSTSPIITDVSGRGVGLDVVRRNVSALGGRIDVEWEPQQGAAFTLILPAALTSIRGLLVQVSGQRFAIPFGAIECILRVAPHELTQMGGHEALHHQGRPYPLVTLSDILDMPRRAPAKDESNLYRIVIIVATAERRMAFVVDGLEGEQEMVIKGTGRQLRHVAGIAGSTVMGSGEVVLVLSVADLIQLALRAGRRATLGKLQAPTVVDEPPPVRRILVVDDSVTTRILEKNVLEAAGYDVQLAVNGQEALGLIAGGELPDLIISDVVMPRLDGFGLTAQIKRDARTTNIPVILVTSLDSLEDKTRGIEVGADAYIVKSQFDQNNLLETIEQLI
ncbi:MAG: hybrid sensor histidine kinase/response regulator [Anaerolineae bacterium]|nr:hybrid sensor histidine kinase/response regulator [Anaerolineae bacterium]